MSEPETLQVPHDVDEILTDMSVKLALSRARVLSAAIFFLADQLDTGNPAAKDAIEFFKDKRTFIEAAQDVLEHARRGK
jgi:hypothetical protein